MQAVSICEGEDDEGVNQIPPVERLGGREVLDSFRQKMEVLAN